MGTRGPQPTPTATLARRGSWRAKVRDGEPEIAPVVLECPAWVSSAAREHWDHIARQLASMGVSGEPDQTAFAMFIDGLGAYLAAKANVDERGLTLKDGTVANPAVAMRDRAWTQVMKALREFGLTPAARSGVKVLEKQSSGGEGKSRFFTPKLAG